MFEVVFYRLPLRFIFHCILLLSRAKDVTRVIIILPYFCEFINNINIVRRVMMTCVYFGVGAALDLWCKSIARNSILRHTLLCLCVAFPRRHSYNFERQQNKAFAKMISSFSQPDTRIPPAVVLSCLACMCIIDRWS